MSRPAEMHFQLAKRVLRYIKGTVNYGIFFQRKGSERLMAHRDSDYAGTQ